MTKLGERIREGRERRKWTQDDLVHQVRSRHQHVKLSTSQLSNYERGINTPRLAVLTAIADVLDEPLDSFVSDRRNGSGDDEDEESEMHRVARLLEGLGQIDLADELFARARRASARNRERARDSARERSTA